MNEPAPPFAAPLAPPLAPPHAAPIHVVAPTAEDRRREFLYHVLPAWLSALGAIGALVLTAYTLLAVHETSGQVHDIMSHMGILPSQGH